MAGAWPGVPRDPGPRSRSGSRSAGSQLAAAQAGKAAPGRGRAPRSARPPHPSKAAHTAARPAGSQGGGTRKQRTLQVAEHLRVGNGAGAAGFPPETLVPWDGLRLRARQRGRNSTWKVLVLVLVLVLACERPWAPPGGSVAGSTCGRPAVLPANPGTGTGTGGRRGVLEAGAVAEPRRAPLEGRTACGCRVRSPPTWDQGALPPRLPEQGGSASPAGPGPGSRLTRCLVSIVKTTCRRLRLPAF